MINVLVNSIGLLDEVQNKRLEISEAGYQKIQVKRQVIAFY